MSTVVENSIKLKVLALILETRSVDFCLVFVHDIQVFFASDLAGEPTSELTYILES